MQFSQLGGEREACAARGRRAELEEVGCEEELARGGAEGAVGVGTGAEFQGGVGVVDGVERGVFAYVGVSDKLDYQA